MDNTLTPVSGIEQMQGSLFLWKTSWLLSHATKQCEVANFQGKASDTYAYVWMVQGSLFSWITLWNLCQTLNRCKVAYLLWKTSWLLSHATKKYEVANFRGQTSDVYAYVWIVQCSLFSWITLWNLCQILNRCMVAYFYGKSHDSSPMQRRNAR